MNLILKALLGIVLVLPTLGVAAEFEEMLAEAERGDAKAQNYVGLSYFYGRELDDGTSVEKDYELAKKWLTTAAENGDSYASFQLGGMYQDGVGVEANMEEAAKWFLESAKKGSVRSRTNIAGFYYFGMGVEKNLEIAYAWASLASFKGNTNARNLVNQIIPLLDDRQKADALAGQYFQEYGVVDPYEGQ